MQGSKSCSEDDFTAISTMELCIELQAEAPNGPGHLSALPCMQDVALLQHLFLRLAASPAPDFSPKDLAHVGTLFKRKKMLYIFQKNLRRDLYTHQWFESNQKPLKMHCKSCALVTSSGHLLGSKQGDRIDETECVIRMNDAPTRGYGQDVGNKTSLRVIAHSSIQRILRNRNELLNMSHGAVFIFWGPSSYMRRDGKGLVYNNLQLMNQILPQLKAYMISRHKMLQFDDLFKRETGKDRKISNTWLSTGWFTMTIALELCDRINVYGMVPPDFCRDPNHLSVPYHYYEPLGPDECTMYISHERGRKGSHHRFITEKRVFENWARTFNIHFFQPDWKPEPLTVNHPEIKAAV
ncbi:alpha-N-acetylgalactosaminide alpha-2,6-sialyltransferase 5 isoform X1 [Lagopus leucura]|nr:alpha-N-acetylgalactosaminide alpha-2,6-sialyltransferase 5 isoform X1 [Lagopus leucura]